MVDVRRQSPMHFAGGDRIVKFHHVGIVVEDIHQYFTDHFAGELDAGQLIGPVFDPNQNSYTAMVHVESESGLELVSPAGDGSPVSGKLVEGGGLHHICYEVKSLETALANGRERGMIPVTQPKPAALFEGRQVAFMYSAHAGLIEFLEASGR